MQFLTYRELREKSVDELLDLLSNYLDLQSDILKLMEFDNDSSDFYYKNHLVYYELNIGKIKNELIVR